MTKKLSAIIMLCMFVGFGFGACQGWTTTRGEKMEYEGILLELDETRQAWTDSWNALKIANETALKNNILIDQCFEINRLYEPWFVRHFIDPVEDGEGL